VSIDLSGVGQLDSMGDTLEAVRDALDGVGLLPRSIEDEWGPGQLEFSFSPLPGLAAADAAVLFRSAVKQVCQRRGLLATFMCRPALPNFFSSGWHLHQSLLTRLDGDASSHVEMRLGEPAANPYLYLAANIAAGLDGIRRGLEPPPPVSADPYSIDAPMLPASLAEAVTALDADGFYREAFGDTLIDYLVMMKRAPRSGATRRRSPPVPPRTPARTSATGRCGSTSSSSERLSWVSW
jgi:glutamine synthetase